ncbi:MAG: hypothetical protein ACM3TN_22555 [Alphaproteobacteria bacterium]
MALDSAKLRALQPPGGYVRPASEWQGIKTLEAAVANPVVGQDTATQQ